MISRASRAPVFGGPRMPRLPRLSEPVQYGVLIAGSVFIAALLTLVAYLFGLIFALALPVAAVIAAVVALRPMTGIYIAVLAMPLERLSIAAGAAAELTPAKAMLIFVAGVVTVRWIYAGTSTAPRRVWLPFIGLLAVIALGITFAEDPFTVAKLSIQWGAFLISAMYIGGAERDQIEKLFMCLAISGGILGAIAATTSGDQTLVSGGDAATGRAQAGFDHPALLAFFLVLSFPPAAVLALRGSNASLRPVWAVCAGLSAAGITLSLTRGAMVALIFSLIVLMLLPAFRRWALALTLAVVVFAVFNAQAIERSPQLQVISERISTISESTEATAANQRPYIWSKTPGIIGDHPFFGVGAGQYPLYAPDYDIVDYGGAPFVHAHDVPLTIAAENGLIGLAFLLAFGIGVTALGLRFALRRSDSTEYAFGVAAAAAVLAAFITGLADYPPGTVVIMGMTFVVIGALVATERLSRPDEPAATKTT